MGLTYLDACLVIYLVERHPRWGEPVVQSAYTGLFDLLVAPDMPETVYLRAAELRARFDLKTPDALHPACAQHHGCDALWTNDDRLAQASHGLARCVLAC